MTLCHGGESVIKAKEIKEPKQKIGSLSMS